MGGTVTVTAGTGYTSTINAASVTEQQTGGLIFNVGATGASNGIGLLVSSPILQGSSAGSTGLIKTGLGTMVLSGANTYTSQTSINQGTLQVNAGGTLGATTAPVTIGTGSAGTLGNVGNLTINTNTQIGALSVISNTSDTTTLTNIGQLAIASGVTLTASSLSVGVSSSSTANTNTALGTGTPLSGAGGTLTVNGNVTVSSNANNAGGSGSSNETAVADLSGLSSFNETATGGTLLLGFGFRSTGILTLAANNNINVGTITVGNANGQNGGLNSSLNLGTGTNVSDANTFNIGLGKNEGNVQFAGLTGSVTIAGTGGGAATANITLANATGGSAGNVSASSLSLAGHQATINAGSVIVGDDTGGNSALNSTATVTFDTGTFTAANLELAVASSGTAGATGTFTLGGPTANSSASGTLTVNSGGNFYLADNNDTTGGAGPFPARLSSTAAPPTSTPASPSPARNPAPPRSRSPAARLT